MDRPSGKLRVGTSGYQYDHWRGPFYPSDLAKEHWFNHYAEHFASVEINNTFYRLPEPEIFDRWREVAPPGFCYALKFSRYATHFKKLKDPTQPIAQFAARARRLRETLGPVLVQLPPSWHVNADRLERFADALPTDIRWAVELRDPSWLCARVFEILSSHGVALCLHDKLNHPRLATADWRYLRFHGPRGDYTGGYSHQQLTVHAARIASDIRAGRDVYAYFNNDDAAHAVEDARALGGYIQNALAR